MITYKKIFVGGVTLYLLACASAMAAVDVSLNFGEPAAVATVPALRPYPVSYDPRHREGDYRYWHDHYNDRSHEKPAEHFPPREFH